MNKTSLVNLQNLMLLGSSVTGIVILVMFIKDMNLNTGIGAIVLMIVSFLLMFVFTFNQFTQFIGAVSLIIASGWLATHHKYEWNNLWILTSVTIACAMFNKNHYIGSIAIVELFSALQFSISSEWDGYSIGFENKTPLILCMFTSTVLNFFVVLKHQGFLIGEAVKQLEVFESGIVIWGSMIGNTAALILGMFHGIGIEMWWRFVMHIGTLSLGYIYNVGGYKGVGGTFIVLFVLDMQRILFRGTDRYTFLFLILSNFLLLYKAIEWIQ